ncbi:enoyl-CoA hydratase/isomerase family protein [Halobacillus sp. A5]|uniref:enoyl-CoA hydratase/isomerase family protein n=1 Tax=Halobacillus sp. A5 TaxID=2880263 RepID=UPI0020A637D1|nr:enoyl-CoA hydratase-related protein [Halobacillus sp. A5]MCP3028350.1 enoyl-CoA hydratase/isomerase family protein [Halobacillus sp. A5]
MFQYIKKEVDQFVGKIIINREEARNALNHATLEEFQEAFEEFDSDPDLRIIIIKGAGEKAFIGGADIKELYQRTMLEALAPGLQSIYKKVEQSSKVTVAAINGHALGGGLELALACDIRVSAAQSKMGLPELNLGIIPGAGGTQRLSRIIGKGRALDMVLTGKVIDAKEALKIGLITYLAEGSDLTLVIDNLVQSLLSKGKLAVHLAKIAVNQGANTNLETGLMIEKLAQTIAFSSEEKEEGTRAFLEKRKPSFHIK